MSARDENAALEALHRAVERGVAEHGAIVEQPTADVERLREVLADVRGAELELRAARQAVYRARALRDGLVLEAVRLGVSQSELADMTGLTRGRLSQIVARATHD